MRRASTLLFHTTARVHLVHVIGLAPIWFGRKEYLKRILIVFLLGSCKQAQPKAREKFYTSPSLSSSDCLVEDVPLYTPQRPDLPKKPLANWLGASPAWSLFERHVWKKTSSTPKASRSSQSEEPVSTSALETTLPHARHLATSSILAASSNARSY